MRKRHQRSLDEAWCGIQIMHEAFVQKYQDVKTGNVYSFMHTITKDDALKFAELNGDYNPLHLDECYGRECKIGKNVVHGMLTASLFSTLIGMYCPGKNSLYLSQTIQFKMPLFYGEIVEARATIMNKIDATKILKIKTEIYRGNDLIVTGEAHAQFIDE